MLRVRWLGRVPYGEAHALQRAIFAHGPDDHLLLLEHDHVYTLGVRTDPANILVDPETIGATVVRADRGGDVTYHGPGQVVGYPILSRAMGSDATPAYVRSVEQVVIDALGALGVAAHRLAGYPGVWVGEEGNPRKIAAIGVRLTRGRTMHGFALNVDPDMSYFSHIIPCGIKEYPVTSLAQEGVAVAMRQVVDALAVAGANQWSDGHWERQDVAWRKDQSGVGVDPASPAAAAGAGNSHLEARLVGAGVDPSGGVPISARKPPWIRVKAHMGSEFADLRHTMRGLSLTTVCEEAGCPNIFECWQDGTATFMINGERCTRACGFCLVDTAKPLPLDPGEPARVAEAVERMGLAFAVVTAVARDDLPDGGADAFVQTIAEIRRRCPDTSIEVLIPDLKGRADALGALFAARPDVCNHNIETVARLQRAVRPSASYARSLGVLARAKAAGLVTKSGLVVGMGETREELVGTLADLRSVGVDIVTIGQYLRPTSKHVPVQRWWTPGELEDLGRIGQDMGFAHVQASPLTRSSYHARSAAASAERPENAVPVPVGASAPQHA